MLRMVTLATVALTLAPAVVPGALRAQQRWAAEVQANAAFPLEDFGKDLDTGFGLEGTVSFRFLPHLAVYAGWDWQHFPSSQSFAGTDMDFDETGYAFGMRWQHPFSGEAHRGPALRLRAGGTYDHIEVENADGDIVADSGHGFGWEAGAGVSVPVGASWRVTPAMRYRSLSRDVVIGNVTTGVDLRYATLGVGISRTF